MPLWNYYEIGILNYAWSAFAQKFANKRIRTRITYTHTYIRAQIPMYMQPNFSMIHEICAERSKRVAAISPSIAKSEWRKAQKPPIAWNANWAVWQRALGFRNICLCQRIAVPICAKKNRTKLVRLHCCARHFALSSFQVFFYFYATFFAA